MTMRTQDFPTIAARLRNVAETFERWAPIAQAVAEERPPHVPPVITEGVARPTEALVLAREDQGITAELEAVRMHAIQAVLNTELAVAAVGRAERTYSGNPLSSVQTSQHV